MSSTKQKTMRGIAAAFAGVTICAGVYYCTTLGNTTQAPATAPKMTAATTAPKMTAKSNYTGLVEGNYPRGQMPPFEAFLKDSADIQDKLVVPPICKDMDPKSGLKKFTAMDPRPFSILHEPAAGKEAKMTLIWLHQWTSDFPTALSKWPFMEGFQRFGIDISEVRVIQPLANRMRSWYDPEGLKPPMADANGEYPGYVDDDEVATKEKKKFFEYEFNEYFYNGHGSTDKSQGKLPEEVVQKNAEAKALKFAGRDYKIKSLSGYWETDYDFLGTQGAVCMLGGVIEHEVLRNGQDPKKILVAGYSQGAHVTSLIAMLNGRKIGGYLSAGGAAHGMDPLDHGRIEKGFRETWANTKDELNKQDFQTLIHHVHSKTDEMQDMRGLQDRVFGRFQNEVFNSHGPNSYDIAHLFPKGKVPSQKNPYMTENVQAPATTVVAKKNDKTTTTKDNKTLQNKKTAAGSRKVGKNAAKKMSAALDFAASDDMDLTKGFMQSFDSSAKAPAASSGGFKRPVYPKHGNSVEDAQKLQALNKNWFPMNKWSWQSTETTKAEMQKEPELFTMMSPFTKCSAPPTGKYSMKNRPLKDDHLCWSNGRVRTELVQINKGTKYDWEEAYMGGAHLFNKEIAHGDTSSALRFWLEMRKTVDMIRKN